MENPTREDVEQRVKIEELEHKLKDEILFLIASGKSNTERFWELKANLYTIRFWLGQKNNRFK